MKGGRATGTPHPGMHGLFSFTRDSCCYVARFRLCTHFLYQHPLLQVCRFHHRGLGFRV